MNWWNQILEDEFSQDYFKDIVTCLQQEQLSHVVYPPKNSIFRAFEYCPIDKTKVVILGMDPYHGKGQAHGLSFSVKQGVTIPPSLRNIYKEINVDLNIEIPKHGCLTTWAKQGVLLLNSALTVREAEPGSHIKTWEPFTKKIIQTLNNMENPIVFLLWGAFARKKRYLITNEKHLVLEANHPSPLSAYSGFMGCKHFSKTNDFLVKNNLTPIDWSIK